MALGRLSASRWGFHGPRRRSLVDPAPEAALSIHRRRSSPTWTALYHDCTHSADGPELGAGCALHMRTQVAY